MWLNKIRKSLSKKTNSSSNVVNLDLLPKLNFDYKLNLDLYCIDKLIIEIFTDLKNDGFIADYHT